MEETVLTIAGIGLLALACQWFSWWVKIPAILFLLLAGIIVGPVTGWLNPQELVGDLLFPMVSLSVAVILFEGSLTLRIHEIAGLQQVVRNLVTFGIFVTWGITTLVTHYALNFSWELSLLFGAVTVVTGPTVIVPILRTVRPNARISNILRWEGIMIDPIGALLAVLVFEFIVAGQAGDAFEHTVMIFWQVIGIGLIVGIAAGYLLGLALRSHLLPEFLHNVGTLAVVFGAFAFSNHLQDESGLLAVTVMGIWLANMKHVPVEEILNFKESLSVLLISVLFIVLAARLEFSQFQQLGLSALWILLAIQFIARPLKIFLTTIGSSLTWQEKGLLSWIAPRGIVAAAVSALFAIKLEQIGFAQADLLVPLTFLVIIGTVILQGSTARIVAEALGVAEPEPKGFLIVGAGPVARAIAKALIDKGFRALLISSTWENIKNARMEGLQTFFGHPISEAADRHLDFVGIGRMLAITPQAELNTLACLHYRAEFGRNNVFSVQTVTERKVSDKHKAAQEHKGYVLFGEEVTYTKLASLINQGAEIRSTTLSDAFSFEPVMQQNGTVVEDVSEAFPGNNPEEKAGQEPPPRSYRETYGEKAIPLFAITPKGRLEVFVSNGKMKPGPGWIIISLIAGGTADKAQKTAEELE